MSAHNFAEAESEAGRIQSVSGAEDADAGVGFEGGDEFLAGAAEVGGGGGSDFVPLLLTEFACEADEVADEGGVDLLGGMVRAAEGPEGADDGLFEIVVAEIDAGEPLGGLAVGFEALLDVGVPVTGEGEDPADAVEAARGSVGSAADADVVPEIVVAEEAGGDADGGVGEGFGGPQAGGEADEVDGGGDDKAFAGDVGEGCPCAGAGCGTVGDGVEESREFVKGEGDAFGLAAEMKFEGGGADEGAVEVLETVGERLDGVVFPVAEGLEVAEPAHFLAGAFGGGEGGEQPEADDAAAAVDEVGLLVGFFLEEELVHPFGRAEEGLAQHLPEEGEGGGNFLVQGFDAEGELRDHAVRFQGFGGFDLGGEAAGVAGELFVELNVIEGAGAEFGEAAAVEGEEGEIPGVEVADIEEQVDVEDAGGVEGVGENRDAGDGVDVEGRIGGEAVDVVEAEPGEGFESLGAVGVGLETVHGVDELLVPGFGFGFAGELGGEFGDAGGFVGEFAGLEGGVGADDDDGTGGVFEEVCPDPVGKEGGFFLPADAEGADAGFHLQGVEGIAAVDPDVEGLEHGDEAFGGAAGVLFAEVEFGAVEGTFDEVGPKSVAGDGFEAFEEEVDDGVLAAGFDPAEAVGGGGLEEVGVDGAAEEVFAEAAFEEGDAEGAGGIAGEKVIDHVGEQELVKVEAGAGEQPVHGDENALVVVFAGGVGSFEAAGVGPGGLEGDGGRNGSGPGAGEKRVEFVEALEGIVVSVEVDKGVGGVIVIAVKLLEGLEGEVGDVGGGAAVVEAVEAVGEKGLLADVLPAAVGAGVDAFHFVVDDTLEFVAAV